MGQDVGHRHFQRHPPIALVDSPTGFRKMDGTGHFGKYRLMSPPGLHAGHCDGVRAWLDHRKNTTPGSAKWPSGMDHLALQTDIGGGYADIEVAAQTYPICFRTQVPPHCRDLLLRLG